MSYEHYRFGFQGQEKDDELKNRGNSVFYKYRIHDPRIGRFFSVDPIATEYPWNSTYAFSENRIVDARELEGLEMIVVHGVGVGPARPKQFDDLLAVYFEVSKNSTLDVDRQINYDATFDWRSVTQERKDRKGNVKKDSKGNIKYKTIKLNPLFPSKQKLMSAADLLVEHTLKVRELHNTPDNEHISLVGFSGGGPVAVVAAKKLGDMGYVVNVITHNGPSNDKDPDFSPNNSSINDALFLYTKNDAVAGRWKGGFKSKFDAAKLDERFEQDVLPSTANDPLNNHSAGKVDIKALKSKNYKLDVSTKEKTLEN